MKRKVKILLALISISLTLGLMSNTYSRYVADTTGDLNVSFTGWKILVNETDITNNNTSTIDLVPIMEENKNIAPNTIAPSSKGYFDIEIDPSNAETSFNYLISLDVLNENIPDLIITKYAILDETYVLGDVVETIALENNYIEGSMLLNEQNSIKPFTIRVYFEWFEGETEQMNDDEDTKIGHQATTENTELQIRATIKFEQLI